MMPFVVRLGCHTLMSKLARMTHSRIDSVKQEQ
jgi:hypothetical protein